VGCDVAATASAERAKIDVSAVGSTGQPFEREDHKMTPRDRSSAAMLTFDEKLSLRELGLD
jgi:hypothetical protein